MGERIKLADVKVDIENGEYEAPDAPVRLLTFLAQVEADQNQAESVLASFNLARHALVAIHELIERGDPWRNPEVLEKIKYAVEDALVLAEAQPAN